MRFGFLRRNNTDLPLFNNRRNGSRSPSPHRRVFNKKHILIGVFVFLVLILLFKPGGSSNSKRRPEKTRFDKYFNAREDLFNDRLYHIKSVASLCTNLEANHTFWPQSGYRYSVLSSDQNAGLNHRYYFAIVLRNSANHFPTIVDNLLRVFYHLGEENVFLSIYEEGSTDEGHTKAMLELVKKTCEAIGVGYYIATENWPTSNGRNAVLEPLKEMYESTGVVFNTLVMMTDDLWCTEEFLELLFHSRGQAASITCSTDVRVKDDVWSISPGHDINGKLFHQGKISTYIQDEDSLIRFQNNLPFRVQSCFSSITVLDPTPFYPPYDFSFTSPAPSHSTTNNLPPWEHKCGFSPEHDMALRYAAAGFGREMIVPRCQTSSNLLDFFKLHRTPEELAAREQLHRDLGLWVEEDTGGRGNPFGTEYNTQESDFVFSISPRVSDTFECRNGNNVDLVRLAMPERYQGVLVIHRELPSLGDGNA